MTLPKDVEELLAQERRREELPPNELDSVWHALAPRVAVAVSAPTAWWLGRRLWTTIGIAAIAFGGGVVAGRALERSAASSSPNPNAAAAEVPSPSARSAQSVTAPPSTEASPLAALATPAADPPPAVLPPSANDARPRGPREPREPRDLMVKPAPPTSSSARPPSVLADERALVEGARTALLRGRPNDALALAEKHASLFPSGELAEDRDFLFASALRDLGRSEEARAKARSFLARYPASALRESVVALAEGR